MEHFPAIRYIFSRHNCKQNRNLIREKDAAAIRARHLGKLKDWKIEELKNWKKLKKQKKQKKQKKRKKVKN